MSKARPVQIGGLYLSDPEVETLRVALADFLMGLAEPDSLGSNEHGRNLRRLYIGHAGKIQRMLVGPI